MELKRLNLKFRNAYGRFPDSVNLCRECSKEVSLNNSVAFSDERREYMHQLCIDCAVDNCKLYSLAKKFGHSNNKMKNACYNSLRRAERLKKKN